MPASAALALVGILFLCVSVISQPDFIVLEEIRQGFPDLLESMMKLSLLFILMTLTEISMERYLHTWYVRLSGTVLSPRGFWRLSLPSFFV